MNDSLVKLSIHKWANLQNIFKEDWPRSISGYYLLETQRNWIGEGHDYGFTVYCPFGDQRSGIVAVNVKKDLYEIIMLCPQNDTSKLEDALLTTAVVDWSRSIVVPFAPQNVVNCLSKVLPRVGAQFVCNNINQLAESNGYFYEKTRPQFEIGLPPDVYIDKLRQEHVETVESVWPHRYPTASWYFSLIIRTGNGYGIFLKQDNSLLSWLFINEAGTLGHLYTTEQYRKRGFAELILRHVSNVLLEENKDVFVFCVKSNFKANALYKKMGFEQSNDVTWCYIEPKLK